MTNRAIRLCLVVIALVAGLFVTVGPSVAPPAAMAAEGPSVEGNYVALAKPARLLNTSIGAGRYASFTALGVAGIPRAGTTGLVVTVTGMNQTNSVGVHISPTGVAQKWVEALRIVDIKTPVMNTVTVSVDETLATNHLTVSEEWDASGVTVIVDVLGYYTKTEVGGGFVPVRHKTLFDTRVNAGAPIAAGGTRTLTLTGDVVPTGAASVYMDLIATNITANGTLIAVPYGTDTVANPVLRFSTGGGAVSNLVTVKLSSDGRITLKNTSTAAVHVVGRAEGYTTSSSRTGVGWRPTRIGLNELNLAGGASAEIKVTAHFLSDIPASGVAAVFANIDVYGTTGSGYLKVYPTGQAATSTSILNFAGMATPYHHRTTGAVLVPSSDGKITVQNMSSSAIVVDFYTHGWFAAPTNYAPAGGRTEISVAHTSAGPCYGYLHPTVHEVRVGCAEDAGSVNMLFPTISPQGHKFSGPVSLVARPNGRFVVTALHASDGEVWTWELAHSLGAMTPTAVRSFRHMTRPLVTATLPNGAPVGFTTDIEGRVWAVDLNIQAPEQPTWKPLDIPAVALVGELTAASTPAGIRLAAIIPGGGVVTGLYASAATTSLGWQSLAAAGATGRVAIGVSQSGQALVAVGRTGDNTLWSASLTAAGGTVNGWHRANSVYDGVPVKFSGSPTLTYDPVTGENVLLFWSGANGAGAHYRVRESAPGSGVFDKPVAGVTTTTGIATDLTAWDYRTDAQPFSRRWSATYLDTAYAQQGYTIPG